MSGLSNVTFNVASAGLGRRAPNKDKISGLLFYSASVPSGFTVSVPQKVYSLAQAVTLGIAQGSTNFGVHWYHVSEFFRANPDGELWIGYYPVPGGSYTFTEISSMCTAANGEIRQIGVYANALAWASSQVTTIQGVADTLFAANMPVQIFYAANFAAITAVTGWSAVTDLRTLTAARVHVVIAQDGGGAGAALYVSKTYSITTLGYTLGCVSKAAVNQSIGNPANFNASNGVELEVLALANGDLISAVGNSTLGALKDKGYTIMRKYTPDLSGSYHERVPGAVAATNDYAWLDAIRPVDKAIRGVRAALLPQLQATLTLNSDGTLSNATVGYFQDLGQVFLDQMKSDGEISGGKVLIDPTQNVLSTSTLTISIQILETAIAEQIVVNIGLTLSL